MQIICPISGIPLVRAPYMLGFDLREEHPIFRAKRKDLITDTLVHKFFRSQNPEEKKLYFLGVLHATGLVSFETIARPSPSTVERYFQPSIQICGWIDYAIFTVKKHVAFPRFIVREDNATMDNIGSFLSALEDVRADFSKKDEDRELLNNEHQRLFKELGSAFNKGRFFTPALVNWLFETTRLADHPQATRYKDILCTRIEDTPWIDPDTLEDLKELIQDNCDITHPLAVPIMGQLNQLIAAQKRIPNFEILNEEEVSEVDIDGIVRVSRKPIAEVYINKLFQLTGSKEEPKRADFAEKWQWLKAMALYKVSQTKGGTSESI